MRAILLGCLLLAGCASRSDGTALLAPCPPVALPTCHAQAGGCDSAPYCYRTLGRVDCYAQPEPGRRTVEEVLPAPAGCYVFARLVKAG